jgi:hypothetical protein
MTTVHSGQDRGEIMQNVAPLRPYFPASVSIGGRVSVWNRRLLVGSIVFILWAASMLALHMAGPNARAMLAGEGMLINPIEQPDQ